MEIEAEHLHRAADIVVELDDPKAVGFAEGALEEFVENSTWRDDTADGAPRELEPLALALGISIGVLAGKQLAEHERHHVPEFPAEEWPEGSGPMGF